ncbi:MAG: sulfate transporter [Pirellulaceae bacterium]|nr:MAG: sulfate transporter [Pirellulaceae bacterium]
MRLRDWTEEWREMGRHWKEDLLASVVVFLVALPLCMGIAIASGVPMDKAASVGIITGIIGGIVVGTLSGCPLQVSGPAAGLAVFVGQLIQDFGYQHLGLIVMLGGLLQITAAIFHVGQWFRAVSPAVIEGMLAGIGLLIFASQFHVMVDDKPPGTGREFGGIINLVTIPGAVWKGLAEPPHRPAALLGVVTIVAIIAWTSSRPQRLAFFPAPLFGVLVTTTLAAVFSPAVQYIQVPDNLWSAVQLPLAAMREEQTHLLEGPSLIENIGPLLLAALGLAFIASAESLLTATAVDAMQQRTPRTKYDRELAAQGTGNLICGLLGVLPITGVIVRSSANVIAGAHTRLSTILHGIWLLVFAMLLPNVLRMIPVSCLAAVLVYTGWRLMNPKTVRRLLEFGAGEVLVYGVTLCTVVVVDLLTGIVVGLAVAIGRLLHSLAWLDVRVEISADRRRAELHLAGTATFIRVPKLAAALEKVPENAELHVHVDKLTYIDHACLDLLMNWEKQHKARGGHLHFDLDELHSRVVSRNQQNRISTPASQSTEKSK